MIQYRCHNTSWLAFLCRFAGACGGAVADALRGSGSVEPAENAGTLPRRRGDAGFPGGGRQNDSGGRFPGASRQRSGDRARPERSGTLNRRVHTNYVTIGEYTGWQI